MSTEHTHGLFDELLRGAKALEKEPELIAKVADAEAQRDRAQAEANSAQLQVERLREHLATLEAKLADQEAALAQATKSEAAAKETLSQIVGLVKGISQDVGAVVELAEPAPVPLSTSESTGDVITSSSDPTSVEGERPFSNTSEPTDPGTVMHSEKTNTGQSEPHPTATSSLTESGVETQSAGYGADTVHSGQAEVTHNAPGGYVKAYWEKPNTETWQSWAARGGELAPWVRPDHDMERRD